MRWHAAPQVSPDVEQGSQVMAMRMFRVVAEVTFPAANGKPRTFALATLPLHTMVVGALLGIEKLSMRKSDRKSVV